MRYCQNTLFSFAPSAKFLKHIIKFVVVLPQVACSCYLMGGISWHKFDFFTGNFAPLSLFIRDMCPNDTYFFKKKVSDKYDDWPTKLCHIFPSS